MSYFYIEPEVAGELAERTVLDSSTHPPRVDRLHYRLSGWLGDALLESFPCFVATRAACDALRAAGATGVRFDAVEVDTSEEFDATYPGRTLPAFEWLRIEGEPGEDDFGIAEDLRLVVSQAALDVLRAQGLAHAELEPYDG